jgi:hypothetical protein
MAFSHGGFPSPLTGGGDPAAPGNVAQGLEAMSPAQLVNVQWAFSSRVAEARCPKAVSSQLSAKIFLSRLLTADC